MPVEYAGIRNITKLATQHQHWNLLDMQSHGTLGLPPLDRKLSNMCRPRSGGDTTGRVLSDVQVWTIQPALKIRL